MITKPLLKISEFLTLKASKNHLIKNALSNCLFFLKSMKLNVGVLRAKLFINELEVKKLIAYEEMINQEKADCIIIKRVMEYYLVQ